MTMYAGRHDYVPTPDVDFCDWGMTVVTYSRDNCERWGIAAPAANLEALLEDLMMKVMKCKEPTRNKVDTLVKNEARTKVERLLRGYVQGMVARNPSVTDEDRQRMGLPLRDVKPTPVGDPEGLVTAMVKYPQEGSLELHIMHVEGTEFDRRANYGVKIAYDVFPVGSPVPTLASELHNSRFTRRKKERFDFDQQYSKHVACFCMCYENSRGKAGRWGPMVTAVIP